MGADHLYRRIVAMRDHAKILARKELPTQSAKNWAGLIIDGCLTPVSFTFSMRQTFLRTGEGSKLTVKDFLRALQAKEIDTSMSMPPYLVLPLIADRKRQDSSEPVDFGFHQRAAYLENGSRKRSRKLW